MHFSDSGLSQKLTEFLLNRVHSSLRTLMQKGPPGLPGRRWGLSWAQGSLFTQCFQRTLGGWEIKHG